MPLPWTPIVYVRLQPDTIYLRDVRAGVTLRQQPLAAITSGPTAKPIAIGDDAKQASLASGMKLVNPFTHPRSLVSDFTVANEIIKGLVRKLLGRRFFLAAPLVVIHPDVTLEGGITQIEIRALRELALGAGGPRGVVWEGRELTDPELLSQKFNGGGRVLDRGA